jgi:hypothetical protein
MMINPIRAADLRWSAPSSPCSDRLSIGLLIGFLCEDDNADRARSQPILWTLRAGFAHAMNTAPTDEDDVLLASDARIQAVAKLGL